MIGAARRSRGTFDVWPGFVDALASILLVFVFMLLVFVLGQYALSGALTSRDRALDELAEQVRALSQTLSLERQRAADLANQRAAEVAALQERRSALETTLAELEARLRAQTGETEAATGRSTELQGRVETLTEQVRLLREQLAQIAAALDASDRAAKAKDAQIEDLGRRLNVALARKAEDLARYRSEFFGRLQQVLGKDPSIRVVGDRFVFQSELLFPSGSDQLSAEGERQIAKLAATLKSITGRIPPDIEWILQVGGHTDVRPIATQRFASNWALSTARAQSVVDFLIGQAIPPQRLAVAGFGEFHPVDEGDSPQALARNRRIEVKLTTP